MSDETKPTDQSESDREYLENSSVLPGNYKEVATGDIVSTTEIGVDYVTFVYLTRGIRNPVTIPLSEFARVGRFGKID